MQVSDCDNLGNNSTIEISHILNCLTDIRFVYHTSGLHCTKYNCIIALQSNASRVHFPERKKCENLTCIALQSIACTAKSAIHVDISRFWSRKPVRRFLAARPPSPFCPGAPCRARSLVIRPERGTPPKRGSISYVCGLLGLQLSS